MIKVIEIVNTNILSGIVKVGDVGILIEKRYVDLLDYNDNTCLHYCGGILKRNTGQIVYENNFRIIENSKILYLKDDTIYIYAKNKIYLCNTNRYNFNIKLMLKPGFEFDRYCRTNNRSFEF